MKQPTDNRQMAGRHTWKHTASTDGKAKNMVKINYPNKQNIYCQINRKVTAKIRYIF